MSESPPDPPEPGTPRREFRFKPTEFERANRPLDEDDHLPAIDVRTLLRQAAIKPEVPAEPVTLPSQADNDVHAILRANLARANEAGLNDVSLQPRRPSKRKRDYWLLMILGNLMFVFLMIGLARNVATLAFGGAGIIIYSIGLTWIMWAVMDDY